MTDRPFGVNLTFMPMFGQPPYLEYIRAIVAGGVKIVADVSELELGMSLHVRDLALPAGVELRSDADLSVVSVNAPKAMVKV